MTRQYIAISKYGPSGALPHREGPGHFPNDEITLDVAYSSINFADPRMQLSCYASGR